MKGKLTGAASRAPGPALTASIFDEVVKDAKLLFSGGGGVGASPEERYAVVKAWSLDLMIDYPQYYRGILCKGIGLGKQLMNKGTSERWKIMADFWAEMTMFMAQSGNAAAHVEQLGRGDEFITQLWALLSNGWDRSFIRRNNDDGNSSEESIVRSWPPNI